MLGMVGKSVEKIKSLPVLLEAIEKYGSITEELQVIILALDKKFFAVARILGHNVKNGLRLFSNE